MADRKLGSVFIGMGTVGLGQNVGILFILAGRRPSKKQDQTVRSSVSQISDGCAD